MLTTQDVLNLEPDCSFEENFFHFRSKVKGLEQFLVPALNRAFVSAPTLQAQLRVLEMYQGVSRRDNIKVHTYYTYLLCYTCEIRTGLACSAYDCVHMGGQRQ